MSLHKSLAVAALALTTGIPSIAAARDVNVPAACILRNRQVESVKPYKATPPNTAGKTAYPTLYGANVKIKAEPGLSPEWLRVDLGQRIQECGMDTKNVDVVVAPTHAGYAVKFVGKKPASGASILEQAQAIAISPTY